MPVPSTSIVRSSTRPILHLSDPPHHFTLPVIAAALLAIELPLLARILRSWTGILLILPRSYLRAEALTMLPSVLRDGKKEVRRCIPVLVLPTWLSLRAGGSAT